MRGVAVVALATMLAGTGCAYFNMVYNAKQLYEKAERERTRPGGSEAGAAPTYDACIKKCLDILRYHGDSKYADDALYMIAMSHLWRGEYVQAEDAFEDLLERFPETDFAESALFHLGLAALRADDVARANHAFEELQARFPESEYNVEAVFRNAERRLDSSDYEAARQELLRFMERYPDSPFVVDAQIRLARTYYDEQRYAEAREQYAQALQRSLSKELEYEARLHVALSKREEARSILADPLLYTEAELPEGLRLQLEQHGEVPADSARGAASPGDTVAVTLRDPLAALPDSLRERRQRAEAELREALAELEQLRNAARKLGKEYEHRTEIAVTRAWLGEPEEAIEELDQIARTKPRTEIAAQAYYEKAEVYRLIGKFEDARKAYEEVRRLGRAAPVVGPLATRKGAAIQVRTQALETLRDADEVRRHWQVLHGLRPAEGDEPFLKAESRDDSIAAAVAVDARFEEMASNLLKIAEVDLFDLDQPRLALREFEHVLSDYPGSLQSARAAYAIAWIYDNVLRDASSARRAYEALVRDYPDSPQARHASILLASWEQRDAGNIDALEGVIEPSSQP